MASITGVNLRRLGVHITTPRRVRTTTGVKRGTIGGNCTSREIRESTVLLHLLCCNVKLDHVVWHLQLSTT